MTSPVGRFSLTCTVSSAPWSAGAPKADWAAAPRSKWQATPCRTPARAPKKPHPMAAAAARRAQMKELDSTPPRHLLSQDAADNALTPAKRMLCSAAVNAELAPAKRLHMMHAPEGPARQRWQQPEMMHEREYDMEGSFHDVRDPMGTQLPSRIHPESRVSIPCPYPVGHRTVSNRGPSTTSSTGSLGMGRATPGLLSVARPPSQHHPIRKEVGNQQSGGRGALAGAQMRTPLRPNSAGSALRGYVPPEHRCVCYKRGLK